MPIRPEWRHLYRGPEYQAQRARILERAGGKCEQCGAPNHKTLSRVFGWWLDRTCGVWRNPVGVALKAGPHFWPRWMRRRCVRVILTMAHLDHDPTNRDDNNVKMLCQWCHLNYDKLYHAETRAARKDAARPLLAGVA